MSMKRYELTKEQWERIKSLLPPEEMGKRGRPRKDNPIMLNGMLWIVRRKEDLLLSGDNCRRLMALGSLYTPNSLNGGMTALWKWYSTHCLRTRIWRT